MTGRVTSSILFFLFKVSKTTDRLLLLLKPKGRQRIVKWSKLVCRKSYEDIFLTVYYILLKIRLCLIRCFIVIKYRLNLWASNFLYKTDDMHVMCRKPSMYNNRVNNKFNKNIILIIDFSNHANN